MRLRRLAVLMIVMTALIVSVGRVQAENGPTLRLVYFYSTECLHCMTIIDEVLTPLQAKYGDQLEVKLVEISDPDKYEIMIRAEEMFGISPEIPGLEAIPVEGSASNEFDLGPGSAGAIAPCESDQAAACAEPETVWAAYFYDVGCQECSSAEYDIRYVRSMYPQLVVDEFNAQDDSLLLQWLDNGSNVPEKWHLVTPVVFIGDDYLVGSEITSESVTALVEKYAQSGAPRTWENFGTGESNAALQQIVARFESFGVLAVAFFGLVDGINPCAFATIIFFVSYLTLSGRKGREILLVGGAFTLGVFLAYVSVGIGLSKVLDLIDKFVATRLGMQSKVLTTLGRWFIGLTAILCTVLAVFSILDYFKARRGELSDMALNLPHSVRKRINAAVRKGHKARSYVVGAFVTGIVVSFLELACTGQVYGPTILAVMAIPSMRARAIPYLLLYNLMFVVPLIIVFGLAYFGVSSKRLTKFFQMHAAWVKLGMGLLFTALAAWLVVSLLA